jgi:phosphatidate phosphatase APP1
MIISDVDDTVLIAYATNRLRKTWHVLLRGPGEREPVPFAADLFSALAAGAGGEHGAEHNPIAYVSSSPTNVAPVISSSLTRHGFPDGPLFLKDFGVDESKLMKEGHVEHKLARIERVLETWPSLPALLVGDTGQADPEIFARAAARWPGRLAGVWLRDAPGGDARAADAALAEVSRAGVQTLRFGDARVAHAWARERGWVEGGGRA